MRAHLQVVAIIASSVLLFGVFELVRRRRLMERYAILWLASAVALLALSVWSGLLGRVSKVIGVYYPPSALFVIAFGFVLVLLLHFSISVSKLADQTKVLAQRLALLEADVEARREDAGEVEGELAAATAQAENRQQERREENL